MSNEMSAWKTLLNGLKTVLDPIRKHIEQLGVDIMQAQYDIKHINPKNIPHMYYKETSEVYIGTGADVAANALMLSGVPLHKVQARGVTYHNIVGHQGDSSFVWKYQIGTYTITVDRQSNLVTSSDGLMLGEIRIWGLQTVYHKIDWAFLPDGIASKTDLNYLMTRDNPSAYGSFSMNRKSNTVVGRFSGTLGYATTASGYCSCAEGQDTVASGQCSRAEGNQTIASGNYSHAKGWYTRATGDGSHAEGSNSVASGSYSHAEGQSSTSIGDGAHAEGNSTTAAGNFSHAEGQSSVASGSFSHAEGHGTNASHRSAHVCGEYNSSDPSTVAYTSRGTYVIIVGNGTSKSQRSNAHTLDWSGNAWFAGTIEGTGIILKSSTEGSSKRFLVTVDDTGTLSAKEITET